MFPIRDAIPHRRPPVMTWALIAINILVFLFELMLPPDQLEALFYLFGVPIFFFPFFFELPAVTYLLFWFLSQILGGTLAGLTAKQVGGIAFWAHAGGFAAGVVLHRLFILPEPMRPRRFERDEYGIEGAWARRP